MTKNMLTVSRLAKSLNLSRSTVLYYEKQGLLKPRFIAENGYRWYGESEIERLKSIVSYRAYGLSISDICLLLEPCSISQGQILENHFRTLEKEINNLRVQQKAIIELLKKSILLKEKFMNKAKWVEIMTAAGLSKEDMMKWHQKFEEMEPEEHQKFLESLGISPEEISQIRNL
ncbi:MerR family transcriptional regulator [Acinetobacter sp. SM34]|nr:MerR family transcriptional regulator [Acinetobacter sp. SM34]MCG2609572.1 MerR family transcriptional regulator [Acinetobacter sp. SM34]